MQEFATGTSYGQIGRDQAQQERDPWLLTPLSSMRPHSADRNLGKRPEKGRLPRTRSLVQPRIDVLRVDRKNKRGFGAMAREVFA